MMTAKILWIMGSLIPMIIGIMHLRGTLFTKLLHPTDKSVMQVMKTTKLEVDKNALVWKAWIGFNSLFSVCLAFMGVSNAYLAYHHFYLLEGPTFLSISAIVVLVLLVLISYKYLIKPVVIVFLLTFILYLLSIFTSLH